jgi:hypothetical protein
MAAKRNASPKSEETTWNPARAPAVKELLDHIAVELADEYVRLMKEAVTEPGNGPNEGNEEA